MRAGSGGEGGAFAPQLTSYDYDAPLSEAGGTGQPGIGGPNKFEVGGAVEQWSCSTSSCLLKTPANTLPTTPLAGMAN